MITVEAASNFKPIKPAGHHSRQSLLVVDVECNIQSVVCPLVLHWLGHMMPSAKVCVREVQGCNVLTLFPSTYSAEKFLIVRRRPFLKPAPDFISYHSRTNTGTQELARDSNKAAGQELLPDLCMR